jgi:hypothetical protein
MRGMRQGVETGANQFQRQMSDLCSCHPGIRIVLQWQNAEDYESRKESLVWDPQSPASLALA